MKTLEEWLRVHPVFSSLGKREQELLVGQSLARDLEKGQVLALQGDVWPYLFLVEEGQIGAAKASSEGRSLLIAAFGAGELFWGPALFREGAVLPATLEAHARTRLHLWSRPDLEPFLRAHGDTLWAFCGLMAERMQRASSVVEGLAFQPVAGRLARLLVEFSSGREAEPIPRSLTLDEIGSRIGTTRELVCRFLHRFADEGLIDITRTEFVIHDQRRLEQLAKQVKG
ncbi:MAG TPA: Crp/Fnr family transcriptional regulator [Anaerolineae bacterium]|nr:Crp/Fnr family transcriptional regulator [Anaerolineae bacterium]HNS52050.1 Crp/Fnr family transcriptional regulator [Anaerolineae bacterium]